PFARVENRVLMRGSNPSPPRPATCGGGSTPAEVDDFVLLRGVRPLQGHRFRTRAMGRTHLDTTNLDPSKGSDPGCRVVGRIQSPILSHNASTSTSLSS